jgi:hypothetical protein
MPLVSGTKLGPYKIVTPQGAGGMGEVYRAADLVARLLRLSRTKEGYTIRGTARAYPEETRIKKLREAFAGAAEADYDAANFGLEDVARGDARVALNDSAPRAAARNAKLTVGWALGVEFGALAVVGHPVPILDPFPNVAERVVQAESVRLLLADGVSRAVRIVVEPCNVNQRAVAAGIISGARGVFPFRFGREAIMVSVLFVIEGFAKLLRVFPAHAFDGKIRAPGIARIGGHHRFILGLRHLEFAQLKRPSNRNLMQRLFVGVAFTISSGTAHHEAAGRNADEVHALGPFFAAIVSEAPARNTVQ